MTSKLRDLVLELRSGPLEIKREQVRRLREAAAYFAPYKIHPRLSMNGTTK